MARKELSVEPREVTGKKVAVLRRMGVLPGNIYGRGLPSVSIQIKTDELERTVRASTANEVIDIKVEGEPIARPVVIHKIQRNPLNSRYLHADFYQVSLREKMRADVPLVVVGHSVAIDTYNGVLVHATEILHIEALPLDIPTHIEVDISTLTELEATIHVRDLPIPANVTVLSDPDIAVVKIASPRVAAEDELEPVTAAVGAPVAETATEEESSSEGETESEN
jgi:large subunit ribosomal protein L25